jgi:hypothetical protein
VLDYELLTSQTHLKSLTLKAFHGLKITKSAVGWDAQQRMKDGMAQMAEAMLI